MSLSAECKSELRENPEGKSPKLSSPLQQQLGGPAEPNQTGR